MTPSPVLVSRQLRLELEAQFTAEFNSNLMSAGQQFSDLNPNLLFQINFGQEEGDDSEYGKLQNFFRGPRDLAWLLAHDEADLPALAMWTGEFQDEQKEHLRIFSGNVTAYWRWFLFVPGIREDGLVALRETVESAMLATLDPELTGVTYYGLRGEGLPQQEYFDQDSKTSGWAQQVDYSAIFEVRA